MIFVQIAIPLPHIRTGIKVFPDELSIEALDTQLLKIQEFGHELQKISSVDSSVV